MSALIVIRNEAGAVVAVQNTRAIVKRLASGAIVWRPIDRAVEYPLRIVEFVRDLHAAFAIVAPEIIGHNLSHSPPDARTGYRTVTDLEKPTEDIAAILEGAPIFDHSFQDEFKRAWNDHVATTRPTPMLPPPVDTGWRMTSAGPVNAVSASTLATLANVQAGEMAHDARANPTKRGKSQQSTDA